MAENAKKILVSKTLEKKVNEQLIRFNNSHGFHQKIGQPSSTFNKKSLRTLDADHLATKSIDVSFETPLENQNLIEINVGSLELRFNDYRKMWIYAANRLVLIAKEEDGRFKRKLFTTAESRSAIKQAMLIILGFASEGLKNNPSTSNLFISFFSRNKDALAGVFTNE